MGSVLNRSRYDVCSQLQAIYSQHFFDLIRSAPGHVLVAFREHLPAPPRQFLCMAAVPGLGMMCWGDWLRLAAHVMAIDPVHVTRTGYSGFRRRPPLGQAFGGHLRYPHAPSMAFSRLPHVVNQFVWIISGPAWEILSMGASLHVTVNTFFHTSRHARRTPPSPASREGTRHVPGHE